MPAGSAVLLEPRSALALGIAAHELTANAVKYGALSVPESNVEVTWSVEGSRSREWLVLNRVELNGPPVTLPERRGFGLTLIECGFAHDVGGKLTVDFAPHGVVATLRAPPPGEKHRGTA